MTNSNNGFFGKFGGRFVPEELEKILIELDCLSILQESAFLHYIKDKDFLNELEELRGDFIGRPNPLMYAKNRRDIDAVRRQGLASSARNDD